METKYDFSFSEEEINKEIIRLTNQMWKLIPMRENNEAWDKQLGNFYSFFLNQKVCELLMLNFLFIGKLFLNVLI